MLKFISVVSLILISLIVNQPIIANAREGEVELIETFPIKQDLFIQGFELDQEGQLIISTGLYGKSVWGYFDWETGKLIPSIELDEEFFGEGITVRNEELWQLTWKEGTVFRWDLKSKKLLQTYPLATEGWGIAYNDKKDQFFLSDGSANIYVYDAVDFKLIDQIQVTLEGELIDQLNELEYSNGAIYANIWYDNRIVKIDPATGKVITVYDLSNLLQELDITKAQRDKMDALNGIAHIQDNQFYLTGKNYPLIFKVTLD